MYLIYATTLPETSNVPSFLHKTPIGKAYEEAQREFNTAHIYAVAATLNRPVTIDKLAQAMRLPRSTMGKRVLELGIDLSTEGRHA